MWVPTTEAEIQDAIAAGALVENASLDLKAALPRPGRNKDIARDVCAMTVDGGVLLYGIAEDPDGGPPELAPIELKGARERIDLVTQTAIAEAPTVQILSFPAASDPTTGYVAVVVPASARAPHMVCLDGENRFYGRGATGNRILTEGDVARLYVRRGSTQRDLTAWLGEVRDDMPFSFSDEVEDLGPVVVACRPVVGPQELLVAAAGEKPVDQYLRSDVLGFAMEAEMYRDQGTPGLGRASSMRRPGPDTWIATYSPGNLAYPHQAHLTGTRDGQLVYWHSPCIQNIDGTRLLMERSLTRAVHQLLATAGRVYADGGYLGAVDCGVAVLGTRGVIGASVSRGVGQRRLDETEYRRDAEVASLDLTQAPEAVTVQMLAPLFEVISEAEYDPLNDRG